jgi:MFS family permease
MASSTGRKWHFSPYNLLICFLVSLGQIAFGYPASIIGVTSAQPPYLVYMGLMDASTGEYTPNADSLIGATSGIFQAGAFFNVFLASYICDRWGRKAGLLWCAFLSILGGAIMTGSVNITMFIVARFFAGGGSWGFLSVTPAYSAELAPPDLRGLMVGLNGVNIAVGYGLASYMGLAFFYAEDPVAQWRTPLGIALVWPVMMILVCFVVPESPRYLLMQGRVEEARAITLKLHRLKGEGDAWAEEEFYQMSRQAEVDRKLDPSWGELWRRPSYRKRCILAMTFAFIGQSSGVLVWANASTPHRNTVRN